MPEDKPFEWMRSSIGKGWSHPFNRKDFVEVLDAHPVGSLASVRLAGNSRPGTADFFRYVGLSVPKDLNPDDFLPVAVASWYGIQFSQSDYAAPFTSSLSVYPVPTATRAVTRARILGDGVPRLLDWLQGIEQGSETGRTETRHAAIYLTDDQIRLFDQ